ncbi:lysyl oxidase family protein, partial [Streptomyces sp. NPDC055509]
MTRRRTARLRRTLLAGTTAIAVTAVTAGIVAAAQEPAKAATGPELSLVAATTSVTLTTWKEEPGVYLDLGTYLISEGTPLELKVTRKSYKDPVTVTQTVYEAGKAKAKKLPAGTVKDFSGLPGFSEITLTDKAGKKVLTRSESFCPNNASGRVRPDAPSTSKYPESCSTNPFTLGSVWGVEKGWAANTYAGSYTEPVQLPAGTYTAKVGVAKKYRDLFGIADKPATVKVTVVERSDEDPESATEAAPRSATAGEHAGHAAGHQAPTAHAGHGPGHAPTPAEAAAPVTSGAGPSYNVGHGPLKAAPPALPWALKKKQMSAQS